MTATVLVAFWRQRLTSPVRVALALFVVATSILPAALARDLRVIGETTSVIFAVIFAAGLIGQEVSSGVLQLTFARPVPRWRWVLARWTGATALAAGSGVLVVALSAVAVTLRGGAAAPGDVLRLAAEQALAAAGVCATVTMFSSLVNGLADAGLLLLCSIGAGMAQSIGHYARAPWLTRAAEEISASLAPTLALSPYLAGEWQAWPGAVAYLSTLGLALILAMAFTNRRELSYAAG
jgi:ABC-type transport system involved in multi-copper enzyme maturation permease subunit